MAALTPRVFSVTLDRDLLSTKSTLLKLPAGDACTFRISLGTGITFESVTRVAVEFYLLDSFDTVVAKEALNPSSVAESVDVALVSGDTSELTPGTYGMVAYVEYSASDRVETVRFGRISLLRTGASQVEATEPAGVLWATQTQLDAAVDALEAEIAALSSVHNDLTDRDAANAHPMSAITGLSDALGGKAEESHEHGMGDVTGLSAALALLAPLASPQLTGRARITDTNNAGLEFWKTTHAAGDRNWEIAVGTEEAGEMELWAGLNGTNNDPRGGTLAARFGVTANSGGPHFAGAVSVGDVAGTRANLGLGTGDSPQFTALTLTGQSLTGSQATSLQELAATWNTTGTPTALKLNVTDTASNAASLLLDLQVGGSSKMKVTKAGDVQIPVSVNYEPGTSTTNGLRFGTVGRMFYYNGSYEFEDPTGPTVPVLLGANVTSALGVHLASTSIVGFSNGSHAYNTTDAIISRAAAGIIGFCGASTSTGGAVEFIEMTAPSAPGSNKVRLYAEDNGAGKTRLMALFPSGAAQQVAIEP